MDRFPSRTAHCRFGGTLATVALDQKRFKCRSRRESSCTLSIGNTFVEAAKQVASAESAEVGCADGMKYSGKKEKLLPSKVD